MEEIATWFFKRQRLKRIPILFTENPETVYRLLNKPGSLLPRYDPHAFNPVKDREEVYFVIKTYGEIMEFWKSRGIPLTLGKKERNLGEILLEELFHYWTFFVLLHQNVTDELNESYKQAIKSIEAHDQHWIEVEGHSFARSAYVEWLEEENKLLG